MAKGIGKKIRTGKSTEAVAGTALGAGAASDMWVTIHLPVTREMFGGLAGLAKVEDRTIVSAVRTMITEGLKARQRAAQVKKIAEATMGKWGQHEQDGQDKQDGQEGQDRQEARP
jgi:hypothetical protein